MDKGFNSQSFIEKSNIINKNRAKSEIKNLTGKKYILLCDISIRKNLIGGMSGLQVVRSETNCFAGLVCFSSMKTGGFADLNNLHKVVKRHVISKAHLQAVNTEKFFGKTPIEHSLDKSLQVSHQHNDFVA
ncbi:hypothetical protein HUJ04_000520 [Dendroctonus ponderosae]|nr:hypothetical protein HUJ04_000520 [Dendroctonus ponderosae]